jgi:5-bromo-4-chloroindolyl phosphate hydrolysis protein
MPLTKEQETLYRQTMEEAKRQIEEIDREMQTEIELTRKKLGGLQESKKTYQQVYEGACRLLGLPVEKKENPEKSP